MAGRITEEQKELINELYAQIGVKTRVAEMVGCSVASVSKYLIPNYVPKADRVKIVFEGEPIGCEEMIERLTELREKWGKDEGMIKMFSLSSEEQTDLESLRKEIF
jgi:predicted transcriptional regulator